MSRILLAERGIDISHETVRFWWNRFGPMCSVRAILELAVTVLPFIALWTAMLVASRQGSVPALAGTAPFAAGLLVRLFMILSGDRYPHSRA